MLRITLFSQRFLKYTCFSLLLFYFDATLICYAKNTILPPSNVPNPLATQDQFDLDAQAMDLYQSSGDAFSELRQSALNMYQRARKQPTSEEAGQTLLSSIDELVFSAIQKAVNNDPCHPKVYWVDSAPRVWFGKQVFGGRYCYDNPDVIYRIIPIDGNLHYIIHGQRFTGSLADATFSLIRNPNSQTTVNILEGNNLVINDDGSYTISIDDQPANGRVNHIQSNKEVVQLYIRTTFGDWQTGIPDALRVEVLEKGIKHPPKTFEQLIEEAKRNLAESIVFYGFGALGVKTMSHPANTLPQPLQATDGTLVTQAKSFGHFVLKDNEALVLTITQGSASYFVVPGTNPWLITNKPGNSLCSMNSLQALKSSDGLYRLVVSPLDPGVYNWVSTEGQHEGTMMVRWQGLPPITNLKGDELNVEVAVVPISELPKILPHDTKWVTAAERKQQLKARESDYSNRTRAQWPS